MMSADGLPRGPAYLQTLSTWLARTRLEDLPPEIVERGRWIMADCIGAVVAGLRVPEMQAFTTKHLEGGAPGPASVLGIGLRTEPIKAALVNGMAGTWLEQDEGNLHAGGGHPGIQLATATLAAAQQRDSSFGDMLLAFILGYEASSRVSRASKLKLVFHPHATSGPIGAAVAVAKLDHVDAAEMMATLNVGATLGIATSRNAILEGVTVRNAYAGLSNYMGLFSRQMVQCGFTGEFDGVASAHGKGGFSDVIDRDHVVERLGEFWVIARSYFKIHSSGRYAHSGIDLAEQAVRDAPGGKIDPESIERIDFSTYFHAKMLDRQDIDTSFGARFSIPFGVATMIYHGGPDLENFEDAAVANPVIQSLARRVFVTENPEYTKVSLGMQKTDMKITFRDGRTYEAHADYIRGEPQNPHPPEALRRKFIRLTRDTWGEAHAAAVHYAIMGAAPATPFRAFAEANRL
jgi:2-methylcitrate dehydratase PrpD